MAAIRCAAGWHVMPAKLILYGTTAVEFSARLRTIGALEEKTLGQALLTSFDFALVLGSRSVSDLTRSMKYAINSFVRVMPLASLRNLDLVEAPEGPSDGFHSEDKDPLRNPTE
jgi:hypothetical protein